jgi:uncharacterized phage infection (PIP) family protein YhgE
MNEAPMTDAIEQARDDADAGNDDQELFDRAHRALEDFIATLGTLSGKLDSLQPVADEASGHAIDPLSESLHALAERALPVGNELKQADQAITEGLHDTLAAIEDRVHAAGAESSAAIARIGDEERELEDAFARMQAGLGDALGQIGAAYDEHVHALEAAQRELANQVGQHGSDQLAAGADQIVNALVQFSASAEDLVRRLVDLLSQAVMGLADAVEQSVHHAQSERAPVQFALDAVKVMLDPLLEEVDRVKDLAESLGVSL